MNSKKKITIGFIAALSVIAVTSILLKPRPEPVYNESTDSSNLNSSNRAPLFSDNSTKPEVSTVAPKEQISEKSNITILTPENFEALSSECFQGAECEIKGDPWEQYLVIKHDGKNNITDLYIAFLRKKLSDPKFKDQYKDILKKMIKDFYPADQIDFQMAAYYNYLGDLDSSLEAYLVLEKKAKANPRIFSAPKINIANTYYDLKKFREALVYYKASLNDIKSTDTNDSLESITFINDRIDSIQERLRRSK